MLVYLYLYIICSSKLTDRSLIMSADKHRSTFSRQMEAIYIFPKFNLETVGAAKKKWRIINSIASILRKNMLRHLFLDVISSSEVIVLFELRSRKTVCFSEQIMSADKYRSIFSCQIEAIVYISLMTDSINLLSNFHWYPPHRVLEG